MHVGIDLGTTNSVIAKFDGESATVIANALGENLTPSVVRIDARGSLVVGRRALRYLESDPANTRAEFKRLMGTAEHLQFEASKKALLPEELSAHVLRSLLSDAHDNLGYTPRAAVVSTPALFELPQNHATARAAELAGLEEVALIQEPIASAIAAGWKTDAQGSWLVFDLGGGTLDVSLLETKEGWLRVVDHAGDNFLGGKDFDNALVDWTLEKLRAEQGVSSIARSNPESRSAIGKLKAACEQAKIDLSRAARTNITAQNLSAGGSSEPVDVDLEVTRDDLERLLEPLLRRSVSVCQSVLERSKLPADAVEKVVFVGGPTLTPVVRARIGELFGGRIAEGIDPMTIVARGAAIYAATAGLEARPKPAEKAQATGIPVHIEHPAVTSDLSPFIVGRFGMAPGETIPTRVRIEREDREFVTADVEVSAQASFVVQVELARGKQNRFRLAAFDAKSKEVPLRGAEFAIVQGVTVADPPLARTVGVALSDDTVQVYFKKGAPLPSRRTFVHRTTMPVTVGTSEDVLNIPVVQGEYGRAHRNRLIGTLRISGTEVKQDISVGTPVEVTLHLDRSGQLRARADVRNTSESFENIVHVLVPTASPDILAQEIEGAERRMAEVRGRAFQAGDPEPLFMLEKADGLLVETRSGLPLAHGGDADAAQRTHRLLLDLNAMLDSAEEAIRWPELEADSNEAVERNLSWVSHYGTKSEQDLFESALKAATEARQSRDFAELERQIRVMDSLGNAAYGRDPLSPRYTFDYYASRVSEASDVARAQRLVERGRAARDRNDIDALKSVNGQLRDLYPGTPEERRRSFGSGVH